jgi:hypothetical protein
LKLSRQSVFDRVRGSILTLTCHGCTREQSFGVSSEAQGRADVARAGWMQRNGKTICPKCPQSPAERVVVRAVAAIAQ